jgi:chaperone required for assembly of F1-ATPase
MIGAKKRVYKTVAVLPAAGGYGIALDGRPLRTPAKAPLVVASAALAAAIAEEWLAQGDNIRPETMMLTRLASTAIDAVSRQRAQVIDHLVGYARSELLCYRAEDPPELARRQQAHWQPLLDWAAETWGAALTVTVGIVPVEQPAAALMRLRAVIDQLDDLELTALSSVVQTLGSLVIGLAWLEGRLDAETAFALSQLDESFQAERWGTVAEAAERRERLREEVVAAARFLALVRERHNRAVPATATDQGQQQRESLRDRG